MKKSLRRAPRILIQNRWCEPVLRRYTSSKAPALILNDVHGGALFGIPTINSLEDGFNPSMFGKAATMFKTWGENEGMYEELVEGGIIIASDYEVPFLYFQCRLGFVNLGLFR